MIHPPGQIAYTILYVLPFYLHPTTRPRPTLSRDAPIVIRTRIRLVYASVALCLAVTVYILAHHLHLSRPTILRSLGLYPITLASTVQPLLLTLLLFAGPLFERAIIITTTTTTKKIKTPSPSFLHRLRHDPVHTLTPTIFHYRNYVAAPLTEEVVFRSLLLPLHRHTAPPTSLPSRLIFATPLYFGIAHVHHLYEFRLTHPFVPLAPAVVRSLVQFAYTTLFGWYASFVFVRCAGGGALWAVVAVHAVCNWMGLPRVWGRVRGGEEEEDDSESESGDESGDESESESGDEKKKRREVARGRLGVGWTVAYYVILVAGALGWWRSMWVLTRCEGGALIQF